MVCRDVLCHAGRLLRNGKCIAEPGTRDGSCSSIDIKLVPYTRMERGERYYIINQMRRVLERKFPLLQENIREFVLIYQTNQVDEVNYAIVRIVTKFESIYKLNEFLDLIVPLSEIRLDSGVEIHASFYLQFEMLDLSVFGFGHGEKHKKSNHTADQTPDLKGNDGECFYNTTIQIQKKHVCPFIKLRIGELPMKFEGSFLIVEDYSNIPLKRFSRWEYKAEGAHVLICLKDFLEVYQLIHVPAWNPVFSLSNTNRPMIATILFLTLTLHAG